ncbi:16S rRNA (guanine(527)-N(7))-methyltransferase RsmG [Motiliproteus sediminis]|uniref:16S rRNA (guanine(527)-N(7))-methyltransferase RsmG n=1 Tax=Motiliproteus sediminis TaxID=1468178 RepID=UPI001AF01CCA|nr:16S rRNA (guanine(527)-N(7))-methyltransferase RsmG [Motiliproteus sediminis]
MTELRTTLERGLNAMGLALDNARIEQLLGYLALLHKWNRAYNLTAIRDPRQMVSRHLLDSLSIAGYLQGARVIDVGSGPGLPGIPLAIIQPQRSFTLLDSNGKKTRFQQQAKLELGLTNLDIVGGRAESCVAEPFDEVVSRAFASLEDMLRWTDHLCAEQGRFLAMKGQYPEEELNALPPGVRLQAAHRLLVPDTDGERHLLILERAA